LNLLVFRDDHRRVSGLSLKLAVLNEIAALSAGAPIDRVVGRLLRAGELECAVADAGNVPVEPYMGATDRLAKALVMQGRAPDPESLRNMLATAAMPREVEIAPPEGFAYYALHPLAYADVLATIPAMPASVLVIGIRSIGTTLSAVTAAALRSRGTRAERITVRPEGHPYNRKTSFLPRDREVVHHHLACNAVFVVVDEGPGLSGSSFLSVAESLVDAGASPDDVLLVCARPPDFDSLCAENGPQRARRFRWVAASAQPRRPAGAAIFVGGGEWRRRAFPEISLWPASWISLERLKYLSAGQEQTRLFKFAGLGYYGEQVLQREEEVAHAGFAPAPQSATDGFAAYPWIEGRPMLADDLSPEVIRRLAEYCAFRLQAFSADCAGLGPLEQMAHHNLHQLAMPGQVRLRLEHPVLTDGRMQPHEWLVTPGGSILKTDSGSHGDDHFFPGVTDIAWDLAGAIVEWRMNPDDSEAFLETYRRASGDPAATRAADFITAYAAFRCAYCTMSAGALLGSEEQARLEQAARQYRAILATHAP
jgi:hypothetical protein